MLIVSCNGQGTGGTATGGDGTSTGGETGTTATNLTIAEVCTSTRTKQDFCNTNSVCDATGIIVSVKIATTSSDFD